MASHKGESFFAFAPGTLYKIQQIQYYFIIPTETLHFPRTFPPHHRPSSPPQELRFIENDKSPTPLPQQIPVPLIPPTPWHETNEEADIEMDQTIPRA